MIHFYGFVNTSGITDEDRRSSSFGSPVDKETLEFEKYIIEMLNNITKGESG